MSLKGRGGEYTPYSIPNNPINPIDPMEGQMKKGSSKKPVAAGSNPMAASLRGFGKRVVKPKKGKGSYSRKGRQ